MKTSALALALVLVLGAAACGSDSKVVALPDPTHMDALAACETLCNVEVQCTFQFDSVSGRGCFADCTASDLIADYWRNMVRCYDEMTCDEATDYAMLERCMELTVQASCPGYTISGCRAPL